MPHLRIKSSACKKSWIPSTTISICNKHPLLLELHKDIVIGLILHLGIIIHFNKTTDCLIKIWIAWMLLIISSLDMSYLMAILHLISMIEIIIKFSKWLQVLIPIAPEMALIRSLLLIRIMEFLYSISSCQIWLLCFQLSLNLLTY